MIDEKIPKEKKGRQILLLAEGSHVLWVVGFRISEYYKIEEHTENILQVTCDGGKKIMADKIRVLLPEEDVNKRISEVAEQISKDYEENRST